MRFVQRDIATELKRLIHRLGGVQSDVAKKVGVSQPTISRVLKRGYSRRSKGRERIEKFLSKNASKLNKPAKIPTVLNLALEEVWDKTPGHAQILAGVIRATNGLVPKK
jgi:predicted transcriptional regulator